MGILKPRRRIGILLLDLVSRLILMEQLKNSTLISWNSKFHLTKYLRITRREKSPYLELFWSAFFPDTPHLSVFSPNAGNPGKMPTRITLNADSFYAVLLLEERTVISVQTVIHTLMLRILNIELKLGTLYMLCT